MRCPECGGVVIPLKDNEGCISCDDYVYEYTIIDKIKKWFKRLFKEKHWRNKDLMHYYQLKNLK